MSVGNRDGVRDAVEQLVVDHFRVAIREVPVRGTAQEISAGRNISVAEMLRRNPGVVNYLRRGLLDPGERSLLLQRMTDLARNEMAQLDTAGIVSGSHAGSRQVVEIMVRQLGRLFLQPMLDAMWTHLEGVDAPEADKPLLLVATQDPE